jgi:hypothetical protein
MFRHLKNFSEKVLRHTFYYDFKNQYEIDVGVKKALKNFGLGTSNYTKRRRSTRSS